MPSRSRRFGSRFARGVWGVIARCPILFRPPPNRTRAHCCYFVTTDISKSASLFE